MSLLSSTQGTPERVWSLINLLNAHEGVLSREDALKWLSPAFTQNGTVRALSGELDGQAFGAATSLGLARREGPNWILEQPPAPSFARFADDVHRRLTSIDETDPDYVVLEAFAFVVAEIEKRQSTGWISASASDFADAVEHAIGGADPTGERRFNTTKFAPWRRWIVLAGLGVELPGTLGFYPYVAERLLVELRKSELDVGQPVAANLVLETVARQLPYLDGGALFNSVCKRTGVRLAPRRLSRVLSVALRDLHDEGAIQLGIRGDATDVFDLSPDGQHAVKTVQTVTINGGVS